MKGRDIWYMSQSSYTKDLLAQGGQEVQERKILITRDQSQLPEEESDVTPELIKAAQKATGEMLWLVTRMRIDLMHAVSKMGSCVTRSPRKVLQIYEQVKGYLKKTVNHGLRFDGEAPEVMMIEAMADASFAPEGDVSHGAFIIEVGHCPVFWRRSGRQSFVTLSTAEAEMVEVIESMVAGEAIGAIADELFGSLPRKSWTDPRSALAILTTDGGSWRTRHLRLRAAAARHSIIQGMWSIQHMSGIKMTADIGTKPLASERLKQLKQEMHMVDVPQSEVQKEPQKQEEKEAKKMIHSGSNEEVQKAASVVRLLTMAAVLSVARGEKEEEGEEMFSEFKMMMVIFPMIIVLLTLLVQCLRKEGVERWARPRSHSRSAARSLPIDAEKVDRKRKEKDEKGDEAEAPAFLAALARGHGTG